MPSSVCPEPSALVALAPLILVWVVLGLVMTTMLVLVSPAGGVSSLLSS